MSNSLEEYSLQSCGYCEEKVYKINIFKLEQHVINQILDFHNWIQRINTSYLSFFYTTAIWCMEILHLKVRKSATKVASRQNSINYHSKTQIMNCVKIMICILNRKSNYTMCKIARWVKHYTMCKIVHSVKKFTQSTLFHVLCGKIYTWLKTFTQPAVVMVVTNMRCINVYQSVSMII